MVGDVTPATETDTGVLARYAQEVAESEAMQIQPFPASESKVGELRQIPSGG
jgi:hypothetical protein